MDSAKKSGQENDEIFDDSNQEEELEEDESDYKIWKKNAPYLYDTLIVTGLEWPSLCVNWMNKYEEGKLTTQRLVIGTQTNGEENNYLMVIKVKLPINEIEKQENPSNEEVLNLFKKEKNRIDIESQMVHDGDVNKAKSMPQKGKHNFIATFTNKGEIHIFDYFKHQYKEKGNESNPDKILKGHSDIGYGLCWSQINEGFLASGAYDNKVCIFDINSESGGTPIKTWTEHTKCIEDVCFHKVYDYLLGSVGDDKMCFLYDTRQRDHITKVVGHEAEVNSIDFNPTNPFIFLTGSSDKSILLWDIRNTKYKMHSFIHHEGNVMNVKWNNKKSNIFASLGEDKKILLWDLLQIGANIARNDNEEAASEMIFEHLGHQNTINDMDWNPFESMMMASVDGDNTLQFWEINSNSILNK